MKTLRLTVLAGLSLTTALAQAQVSAGSSSSYQQWFYGGGIGLGFGDVQYFEIAPLAGINLNPRTALGASVFWRYRKDTRYEDTIYNQTLTTNDYGITPFVRFRLTPTFYLQGEYEYLDYEYFVPQSLTQLKKKSDTFGSLLAGGGISQPLNNRSSLFLTALYNFNYNDDNSPYTDPWVIRIGVGIGF